MRHRELRIGGGENVQCSSVCGLTPCRCIEQVKGVGLNTLDLQTLVGRQLRKIKYLFLRFLGKESDIQKRGIGIVF